MSRILPLLVWPLAAALAAYACAVVAWRGTPIDDALPLIAVIVVAVAVVSHPAIQIAVPLLMVIEISVVDERLRFLLFGLTLAGVFATATLVEGRQERTSFTVSSIRIGPLVIAAAAILLLRWIPIRDVQLGRELLVLAIALGIVAVLRATPLALMIGIVTALFTPAIPLRTLLFPLIVLVLAGLFRAFTGREIRGLAPAAFVIALMMTFFAWSGVLARATPILLRGVPATSHRYPVNMALKAGQSVVLDVPHDAAFIIFSGANMPGIPRGTILGRVDPGAIVVKMGDIADWGAFRREQYFATGNPLPRDPAGQLRGYGQSSWLDGAGRIPVRPAQRIIVTADRSLPPSARLQIDAFETRRR